MILFQSGSHCTATLKNAESLLKEKGFETAYINFQDDPYPDLSGYQNVKLFITDDHIDIDTPMNARQIINHLKPKKVYYAPHDLGIYTNDEKVQGMTVLLPSDDFKPLFKEYDTITIGYPRFIDCHRDVIYDEVFFISSVYIYDDYGFDFFKSAFEYLSPMPIKFPNYPGGKKAMGYAESIGFKILDKTLDTFELLKKTKIAISNANSSVAIEAAIAGCISVNIGWPYNKDVDNLNIISTHNENISGLYSKELIEGKEGKIYDEYMFNQEIFLDIIGKDYD